MLIFIKTVFPLCKSVISKEQVKILWSNYSNFHLNLNGTGVRNMAGHSKWQNIRHVKAAKDAERSLINSRFVKLLKKAALEGGGTNPKLNSKLASVISQAKDQNVFGTTIDNALKRLENAKLKPLKAEIVGSGGCLFIVELETEMSNQAIHELKTVCRKVPGYKIAQEGRASNIFHRKGVIKVSKKNDCTTTLNNEEVLDDAILAGAEEVTEEKDDNDNAVFHFITSAEDIHKVKKELESMQYVIEEFGLEFFPYQRISLNEEDMNYLSKFYNLIEELPDVQRIYDNVEY